MSFLCYDFSDPPKAPILSTSSITSSSVTLEWKKEKDDINPVSGKSVLQLHWFEVDDVVDLFNKLLFIVGYILHCIIGSNEIQEKKCSVEQTNYTFDDLLCGTRYEFSISACNSIGCSEKRHLITKTKGITPIAPDKESLLASINSTSVLINLFTFLDGGCPLKHYSVKYKKQTERMWTRISDSIPRTQKTILIDGLHTLTWYQLQITAYSQAGSSEAEYSFLTSLNDESKLLMFEIFCMQRIRWTLFS